MVKPAVVPAPCPFFCQTDPTGVIARLDPKSGLPDFGIRLSKSETSDFDAIQYPPAGGYWIARSSRAVTAQCGCQSNRKMLRRLKTLPVAPPRRPCAPPPG